MAVASRVIRLFENGKPALLQSKNGEVLWKSISVTEDGNDNGLTITENSGAFDFNGKVLSNIATPVSGSDAATKAYADAIAGGLDPKDGVDLITVAALPAVTYDNGTSGVGATLTADANGALSVDGAATTAGMRVAVTEQAAGLQNGIYDVTDPGDGSNPFILTRSVDFDGSPAGEVTKGARFGVIAGNTKAGWAYYVTTAAAITIGTTAIDFGVMDSTPTATSGSGGAVQGKVTADSDLGLSITAGVASSKIDDSTINFNGSGQHQIKDAGVTLAKMASDSVDENKIVSTALGSEFTGGSGTAINLERAETATNNTGSQIDAGKVVYLFNNGGVLEVRLADADAVLSPSQGDSVLGVAAANIADSASGLVYTRPGTKVTPSGGGSFVRGQLVYVSATAGDATATPPTEATGMNYDIMGRAISATVVRLDREFIGEVA